MSEPTCQKFEGEGLARVQNGEEPDDHERGCDDCQRARRGYDRLVQAIGKLPPLEPPAGWQEQVFRRIDRPRASAERSSTRWAWALAAALAAVVVAVVILRRPQEEALALHQEVFRGAGRRADSAVVGDRLGLRASTGGSAHAELRVYRGEREIVLRCPGDTRCRTGTAGIEADFMLESRGSYRALLIAADVSLPAPKGSLDEDARAVYAAGGRVEMGVAVDVE